ncbi:hypothetical protein [Methylosinus sp. Ce-a6]|uniref:hypothetical protein n=1 Tax=Methylosinus sp. Ce-a6 TaxID=2172005 RepID=UPI00135BD723|nr:hypothetical protein [Methylosinus sp. Ce-a6]
MISRLALCLILFAVAAGGARAQEGGSETVGESIGNFFEGLDMRRTPPPPADFVVRSRTGATGYTPFVAPAPDAAKDAKKSAARAATLEKELAAAAAANRARAARVKIPDAPKERRAETKQP